MFSCWHHEDFSQLVLGGVCLLPPNRVYVREPVCTLSMSCKIGWEAGREAILLK